MHGHNCRVHTRKKKQLSSVTFICAKLNTTNRVTSVSHHFTRRNFKILPEAVLHSPLLLNLEHKNPWIIHQVVLLQTSQLDGCLS